MKLIILSLLALQSSALLNAQNKYFGKYYSYFQGDIIQISINSDYKFEYSRSAHMSGDQGKGIITFSNDTLFFAFYPDTINTKTNQISRVGNPVAVYRPKKLYFSNDKLYGIDTNGQIVRKTKHQLAGNFTKRSGWEKWYRKKYFLFGPYITKRVRVYYVAKIE